MTLRSSHMIRHSRVIIAVLALLSVCGFPLATEAHDGPHSPAMMARVERAVMAGPQVDIRLTLTGLGGPLVLQAIAVPGASVQFDGPVTVSFAQDVTVSATLTFATPPQGAITLLLDFGVAGQGAVTVIPSLVQNTLSRKDL
ncbi:hypothetical protein [uncultured Tateyamaria sp.]|uniref:hypothetical protein n=1 Tax=uncultured Tateyamaria sp. TaxID=455651 RepID=UPI00261765D9|nr:hypothetical protein [uncultured Tateyamaria sp.]